MILKKVVVLAFISSALATSACAPLIVAGVGAGGVVVADKAVEEKSGGDGLF